MFLVSFLMTHPVLPNLHQCSWQLVIVLQRSGRGMASLTNTNKHKLTYWSNTTYSKDATHFQLTNTKSNRIMTLNITNKGILIHVRFSATYTNGIFGTLTVYVLPGKVHIM